MIYGTGGVRGSQCYWFLLRSVTVCRGPNFWWKGERERVWVSSGEGTRMVPVAEDSVLMEPFFGLETGSR